MHFSDCLPIWFLAIFSFGSWGTPTFLTFPDLSIHRRLTRFNLVTGTIFWYFWRGIIRPQLTVPYLFHIYLYFLTWESWKTTKKFNARIVFCKIKGCLLCFLNVQEVINFQLENEMQQKPYDSGSKKKIMPQGSINVIRIV